MNLRKPFTAVDSLKGAPENEIRERSLWVLGLRRLLHKKIGMGCLIIILVLYVWGILATWTTPYNYSETDLTSITQGPSFSHLNGNISALRTNPHLLLFPVGAVTILVFCFNLLGDALNDAFNPRTR